MTFSGICTGADLDFLKVCAGAKDLGVQVVHCALHHAPCGCCHPLQVLLCHLPSQITSRKNPQIAYMPGLHRHCTCCRSSQCRLFQGGWALPHCRTANPSPVQEQLHAVKRRGR